MRIAGGTLRGRVLKVPKEIRPTQEKVRQALFSILGDLVPGARFLDLFAGSGAVGIEAWSRGAEGVVCVESEVTSLRDLEQNIKALAHGHVSAVRCDAHIFLSRKAFTQPFSLIFADPPYDKARPESLVHELLGLVRQGGWLADDGLFIIEESSDTRPVQVDGWKLFDDRRYGAAQLRLYLVKS
jgi:16S rRNA (guanine966-N2)-methyltransferase